MQDKRGELVIPWTTLTNFPVQGTGADVMKIARIVFYKRIKARGIPCKFITTVHDSIVVDAESQYLEEITALFHEAFAAIIPNIKTIFGYDWKTPLECEVKAGPNFMDMVKIQ